LADVNFQWRGGKYPLDFKTLTGADALLLEEVTKLRPGQLLADFSQGGTRGILGLLLVALKRADVAVTWDELLQEPLLDIKGDLDETGGDPVDPTTASTPRSRAARQGAKGPSARSKKS
jgi:hypothetical protein